MLHFALPLLALLLTGPALAEPGPVAAGGADCPEQACPDTRWEAPRLAGAYDFLPGPYRPFQLVAEPVSWNQGAWNLGPLVAVSAPVSLEDGLDLDAWHLMAGAWTMPTGPAVRWRLGGELGLCLRSFSLHESELGRDWAPAVALRAGLSWKVLERWRIEPSLRLAGELPPTSLLWRDQTIDLPTVRLQFLLGVHLPSPGR